MTAAILIGTQASPRTNMCVRNEFSSTFDAYVPVHVRELGHHQNDLSLRKLFSICCLWPLMLLHQFAL